MLSKNFYVVLLFLITVGFTFTIGTNVRSSTSAVKQKAPITIYLAGDSTVSNYSSKYNPRAGWGQVLGERFDEDIVIINEASPGRSSKSFIQEGRLRQILDHIQPGDYLFIQFGHNDEKKQRPVLYTEPSTTYKTYLKQYIDGARKKRAIPILVTPVERWRFSQNGKLQPSHGHYPEAMKELGREEGVPVIDLTSKSRKLYQELGPEKTKEFFLWLEAGEHPNYPKGIIDGTHFQEYGAREIARLVVEGVRELHLPLSSHLK